LHGARWATASTPLSKGLRHLPSQDALPTGAIAPSSHHRHRTEQPWLPTGETQGLHPGAGSVEP
jgi:hypothetical protein